jgi:beta-lactamase superfamily II metal-dependent hydrolase
LSEHNKKEILDELKRESKGKEITRFISTHPDHDHIQGIQYLNSEMPIINFYCVQNETTKAVATDDFNTYCTFRDGDKAFYLSEGCSRRWMNEASTERGAAGISILWPVLSNQAYKEELKNAKEGKSPNNISIIARYHLSDGPSVLWMGDLETDFMETIKNDLSLSQTDIVFAPHHGRKSGRIPQKILSKLNPKLIIIGEADSDDLHYYGGYNTITQNSAGDITFDCQEGKAHIYVSNSGYEVDFLTDEDQKSFNYYIGTLTV